MDLHLGEPLHRHYPGQANDKQEGIATVVVAVAAYWFIENYPDTSKFLTKSERSFIHERLHADSDAIREEKFSWAAVREAFSDPSCWLYGLGFHTMSLPLYTLSLFLASYHALKLEFILTELAHHHQGPRIQSCSGTALDNPTIRRRLHHNSSCCHRL